MAELTINTADIAAALQKNLEGFTPDMEAAQVGRVIEVGDGIATVSGLPGVGVNELLEFEGGVRGLALNLDEESIGAVILGDGGAVSEGTAVKATGQILSVPVGDGLLGRVVDALGIPVDGKGPLTNVEDRRMEIQAPGIIGRKPVHEPLQTGIKAIDSMTPIGRGQRELIIGDRKTGKTTIAIDTIINQRGLGVKCIYVAIGLKESTVANTVATLAQYGAMDYTVVVVAGASDPAPFKYLAPYAGCAMGQHWMENGEHGLIVYDDLSKQAEAYRQVSLLLRRPPGREAYPGDVFYLHSRLLERAAKLSDANGAGSLTALPIIETKAGDISAYIPTNVISITDGQVFLQDDLFKSGVRPAFDTGQSVSRVGGAAQIKAMKKAVGTLKGDLSQFRELEAFAAFGSELDKVSQAALDRGYRLVELLKQPLNSPMPVEEQVVSLYAATNGYLDAVPVEDVSRFEKELLEWFRARHGGVLDGIKSSGDIADVDAFEAALQGFAEQFQASDGSSALVEPTVPAVVAADAVLEGDEADAEAARQPRKRRRDLVAGGAERVLRRRIKSVQSTKKITKAMELIAASRILKAQQRVNAARPYSEQITEVIRNLAAAGAGKGSALLEQREEIRTVAFVAVAGDRGLCGGYNTTVIRTVEREMARVQAEGKQTRLITVGKKATGYFRFRGFAIDDSFVGFSDEPTYEDARKVAEAVVQRFEDGEYDAVEICYTQFISAGVQRVQLKRFVPIETDILEAAEQSTGPSADYEFEPGPERDPRPAAAPLRRGPPVRRPARGLGLLLRRPAASHEVRHRQRRGADHQAQPRHEPGPPGRDHHRDHGDRQRRRGPALRPVRRHRPPRRQSPQRGRHRRPPPPPRPPRLIRRPT